MKLQVLANFLLLFGRYCNFVSCKIRKNKTRYSSCCMKLNQFSGDHKMAPTLGRCGGGPGVFKVALIHHPVSFLKSTNGKYDYKHVPLHHEI